MRGREVVVTEKLDGENTTLYADGLHARSVDSAHHPSRTWVKALQGRIGAGIPAGWRVCGENMFARHSIPYEELEGYFYGFSVWDGEDTCLDWDATVAFLRGLGVPVPRVLWRGVFDERALRALRLDTERREGYVVRTVAGFPRAEFGVRVAKWVRPRHVRTDTHWMHAAVVENGLAPSAALWAVRSGAAPEAGALLTALGGAVPTEAGERAGELAEMTARLDVLGRRGEARLAGVLAALLSGVRRERLLPALAGPLGLPLARRVADLVGLYPGLQRPYPDEERRAGLVRMSSAADLGVLHALAATALPTAGEGGGEGGAAGAAERAEARAQADWSALWAEDAGLLGEEPLGGLQDGLREALAGLDPVAADRCWAQAREAYARGTVTGVADAVAAGWRWRSGEFPRLVHLIGPSGSGKSAFAARLPGVDASVGLDELRAARGSRADQRDNGEVLREGLDRLDTALVPGATVVWDATSLNPHQRSLVRSVAARRDALVTHVVLVAEEAELVRRNATRAHPVPAEVLTGQLRRFVPPYPGQAHRTWYVGADGRVGDTAGSLGPAAGAAEMTTVSTGRTVSGADQ
ncbi:RNA ligase family protein [Kitasatospora sp. HUAS MG31]|uniref:RNA ligase family protein n=1 Tax=Kitasatospora camelliae TaxID=3156397 RepID=A0AAU8K7A2_9ACTN